MRDNGTTVALVTVYARDACHLCDEAIATLRGLQRQYVFEIDVVDIDGDLALVREYGLAIPVVAVPGRAVATAPLDGPTLAKLVNHLPRRRRLPWSRR